MPCKVLELTQHRWYVVRGTWYVVRGTWGPRTEGRHHTTFPAHPRSSPTTPMAATSHRCIFPGSLSEIIDSRNSSPPALCLSQTCVGPLLLPTYQSSCKERREEERGFFVLISVCKRACKVLPGHRSKRGEYMPPSFMCSLALPAACLPALALALAGLLTPRPALLRKLSSQKSSP